MKVLLASASPRRRELMKKIFPRFDVCSPDVDESFRGRTPEETVCELARRKGLAASEGYDVTVAADTLVCLDGEVLGKPHDGTEAVEMLKKLNGRIHTVLTGVYLKVGARSKVFSVGTEVAFYKKSEEELATYVRDFDLLDKAGAYAIQDGVMVKSWSGSYDNVVGLPTEAIAEELEKERKG